MPRKGHFGPMKPKGAAGFRMVWYEYTKGAKDRRLAFELTEDEFKTLTQRTCYYCGQVPNKKAANYRGVCKATVEHGTFTYNGIDRVDSLVGYKTNNCVPCCNICNKMKLALSVDEWYAHMNKILKYKEAGK